MSPRKAPEQEHRAGRKRWIIYITKELFAPKKGFALGSKVPVGLFDLQIFHFYETSQLRHWLISSSLLPSQIHE